LVSIPVVLALDGLLADAAFTRRSVASSDRAAVTQATPELFQFGK
jgi:hypothetical protein